MDDRGFVVIAFDDDGDVFELRREKDLEAAHAAARHLEQKWMYAVEIGVYRTVHVHRSPEALARVRAQEAKMRPP